MDHVERPVRFANFHTAHDLAEDVICTLEARGHIFHRYGEGLRYAFRNYCPVFTVDDYAKLFLEMSSTDPVWTASAIFINAEKESEGSAGLFELYRRLEPETEIAKGVLAHTVDEIRHSHIFAALARAAFPGIISEGDVSSLKSRLFSLKDGGPATGERLSQPVILDHLVQMNLGEIRTRINISLMAPVISALAPISARGKVRETLNSLVYDEMTHIAYTSHHIENHNCEQVHLNDLMCHRLKDLCDLTNVEIGHAVPEFA